MIWFTPTVKDEDKDATKLTGDDKERWPDVLYQDDPTDVHLSSLLTCFGMLPYPTHRHIRNSTPWTATVKVTKHREAGRWTCVKCTNDCTTEALSSRENSAKALLTIQ